MMETYLPRTGPDPTRQRRTRQGSGKVFWQTLPLVSASGIHKSQVPEGPARLLADAELRLCSAVVWSVTPGG